MSVKPISWTLTIAYIGMFAISFFFILKAYCLQLYCLALWANILCKAPDVHHELGMTIMGIVFLEFLGFMALGLSVQFGVPYIRKHVEEPIRRRLECYIGEKR